MNNTLNDYKLKPNASYDKSGIIVTYKEHGIEFTKELMRTTAKCVVVNINGKGMEQSVRMANVIKITT